MMMNQVELDYESIDNNNGGFDGSTWIFCL